jgi:hypothetical protein
MKVIPFSSALQIFAETAITSASLGLPNTMTIEMNEKDI